MLAKVLTDPKEAELRQFVASYVKAQLNTPASKTSESAVTPSDVVLGLLGIPIAAGATVTAAPAAAAAALAAVPAAVGEAMKVDGGGGGGGGASDALKLDIGSADAGATGGSADADEIVIVESTTAVDGTGEDGDEQSVDGSMDGARKRARVE